jgi:hypothetical protein
MKKIFNLLVILVILSFTACQEDKDVLEVQNIEKKDNDFIPIDQLDNLSEQLELTLLMLEQQGVSRSKISLYIGTKKSPFEKANDITNNSFKNELKGIRDLKIKSNPNERKKCDNGHLYRSAG